MKIAETYNFFFHPLDVSHSKAVKVMSVVTAVALSVLTAGGFALLFLAMQLKDRYLTDQASNISPANGFVGIAAFKQKQRDHLQKLQVLANAGKWEHLREHTSHPDSGFDWWMFPINRPSRGQGWLYTVDANSIALLKKDASFMQNYRKGVILVAKSWGWDLETNHSVKNNVQKWTHYDIRLEKMLQSLQLFGQKDLFDRLHNFIVRDNIKSSLDPRIQNILRTGM